MMTMTAAVLSWALLNGALTLPGTGIEIRMAERPDIPFTLLTGADGDPLPNPLLDPWPSVFREPLEAPYRPDLKPIERRGRAIADGLVAWANCSAAKVIGITKIPDNFGEVVMKLQAAAGIPSSSPEAFSAAQKAWMAEWEAEKRAP